MSRRDVGGARVAAFVLTAAFSLSGCGSSDSEPAAGASGAGKSGAKPGMAVRQDMVAAVSASHSAGAVDVRFALSARPAVGQPLDVRLALTPTIELDRMFARFQASDGLEMVKGGETAHLDRPAVGTEVPHTVTVVPKSDGIYYVTAVVVTDTPTESVSRSYSIPIIAGAGLAELPETVASRPQSQPGQP